MSTSRTHNVGGNGGGSLKYVGSAVVAGAAATTLSISGLDLDTDGQYLIEFSLKNATAGAVDIRLFYNADTTVTNYDTQIQAVAVAALAGARGNTATICSMLASSCSTGTINLSKDVDGKPTALTVDKEGTSATLRAAWSVQFWRTAGTNVTALIFSASVGSAIDIGSYVRIWKIRT